MIVGALGASDRKGAKRFPDNPMPNKEMERRSHPMAETENR
jgi:hypothetical protein